jgi:poly(hydroxyalkanoate) granule-associated protein
MSNKERQAELKESAHKIWLAGLGALQTAEEESSKLFSALVEKGKNYEGRSREQFKEVAEEIRGKVETTASKVKTEASGTWERVEEKIDDAVTSSLGRFGVPSRDEIATLTKRVEELTKVVEQLKTPAEAPAKKTTRRKTSPKATSKAAN